MALARKGSNTMNEHEFLKWLCWERAKTADRFYPPDETAEETHQVKLDESDEELTERQIELDKEHEMVYHSTMLQEAVEFFVDARTRGIDAIGMAESEHRELQERADDEVEDIDWSFYDELVIPRT